MKRKIVNILSIILIFIGFFIFFQVFLNFLPHGKGALQVTSNVAAKVLINGKLIGNTPLCLCEEEERIDEGGYTLQLVPQDSSSTYTTKIKVGKDVLTAVDRTFLPGSYASSYTLYLSKIYAQDAQLFVSSIPNGALISMDGTDSGTTPLLINNVSDSAHEIEIQKGGYAKKTIRIKAQKGYKLVIETILGTIPSSDEVLPGSEPSPTPTPTLISETVKIINTPTGFLRVREEANINSKEIGRVNPGDILTLISEENGWYKIQLPNSQTTGYVSSDFAIKEPSPTP
jgi:uncharacterized protein YgiM (DUF1202 family)